MTWFIIIVLIIGIIGYLKREWLKKLFNARRPISPERLEWLKKQVEIEEANAKEIENKAKEAEVLAQQVKEQRDKIKTARDKAQAVREKINNAIGGKR